MWFGVRAGYMSAIYCSRVNWYVRNKSTDVIIYTVLLLLQLIFIREQHNYLCVIGLMLRLQ